MYTAYDMTAQLSLNTSVICSRDDGRQLKKQSLQDHPSGKSQTMFESLKSGTCHRFLYGFTRGELHHSTALAETQRAICTLHIDKSTQVSTVRVVIALNVPITHLLTTY